MTIYVHCTYIMLAYASFTDKGILATNIDGTKRHLSFFAKDDDYTCYEPVPLDLYGKNYNFSIWTRTKKYISIYISDYTWIFFFLEKDFHIIAFEQKCESGAIIKLPIKSCNPCLSAKNQILLKYPKVYMMKCWTDSPELLEEQVLQLGGIIMDDFYAYIPECKRQVFKQWMIDNHILLEDEKLLENNLYKQRKLL